MGNKQNKENQDGLIDYQRFGAVLVNEIQDSETGDQISQMEFSRQVPNQKQYNDWVKQIQRIEDSQSRETILLPFKHNFVKGGFCGGVGSVNLIYENFPFILKGQIMNRKKLGRFFNEAEMWYLLYSIIRAGNKFEKLKKKIGDVSPYNILINDDGQIKVLSTCSIPNQTNNFHKIIEDKNAHVYLAPQQLKDEIIQKGQYPYSLDSCRAQVFSIGLTILSSGILQDCYSVYESHRVNEHRLHQYLGIFRQKYSNYLYSTLSSMLEIQPNYRRAASDIYNQLSPYEERILQLQPFPERNSMSAHGRPLTYDPRASAQQNHQGNVMNAHYSQPQQVNYNHNPYNSGYHAPISSGYHQHGVQQPYHLRQ